MTPTGFGDRERFLWLTTAVMAAVALFCVGWGVWYLDRIVFDVVGYQPLLADDLARAERLVIGTALLATIGGAAVLLRVVTPFARRLEASEARTQALVSHAAEAILSVDVQGYVGSCNSAAEAMFGYEAAAVVGAHLKLLLPSLDEDGFAALLAADGPNATARLLHRLRGRRRDGMELEVELSLGRLPASAGATAMVVARDVTQRRRAEERLQAQAQDLQQTNDELQSKTFELAQINRELNDFTYIATHDLKEPLRGIGAYCQMIVEDAGPRLDQEGRNRLATLQRLTTRVEMLVDDLLKYARAGCCRPEQERVELDQVVSELLPTLAPLAIAGQAPVRVAGPLPVVRGDATLLGEVLRNLVANGLKFNRSSEPAVEIGAVTSSQPTVYVRDNGIGIAPAHHEEVFEMFRRLHGRSQYEGTGAGLAIVRKIVKAHGGRVWIESEPGEGTTVWMTFPRAEARGETSLAAPHFACLRTAAAGANEA